MAYDLEIVNGKASMFWVGKTPWHGLGTELKEAPTIEEGIKQAGLDWGVGLKGLQTVDDGQLVGHRAIYRVTDNKILGVVGPAYVPLQNVDAFKWFQPLLDAGEAKLHTAGSLDEGKKLWVLAEVCKEPLEIAEKDFVRRFILLSNSHDGTRAIRAGFTPIRVVCANTLAMSHNDGESKLIKVLHTKNCVTALEELRKVMNLANQQFEATAKQYRRLAHHKISHKDLREYVKIVLGVEKEDEKELAPQTMTKIREILTAAESGKGNTNPSVQGTLWAGYNGFTEYLSYTYGRNQGNRLSSLWFGVNANLSQKALEVALQMAG